MLIQQRDNEIGILLGYLNKKKAPGETEYLPPSAVPVQRVSEAESTHSSNFAPSNSTANTFQGSYK